MDDVALPPPPYISRPSSSRPANSSAGRSLGGSTLNVVELGHNNRRAYSTESDMPPQSFIIRNHCDTFSGSRRNNLADPRDHELQLVSVHMSENCSIHSELGEADPDEVFEPSTSLNESPTSIMLRVQPERHAMSAGISRIRSGMASRFQSRPQTSATTFLESCSSSMYDDSSFESITSSEASGDWPCSPDSLQRQSSSGSGSSTVVITEVGQGYSHHMRRDADSRVTVAKNLTLTDLET